MSATSKLKALAILGAVLAWTSVHAQSSFRIDRLYSQQDGRIQFVVLMESLGLDNQQGFAGLALTTTSHGMTKTFVFPNDLPSAATANRHVMLATFKDFANGEDGPTFAVDYMLPRGFLPTEDGTISLAGVDAWSYGSLPVDGFYALARAGNPVAGVASTFLGATYSSNNYEGLGLVAYEYYNAARDHYFISASLPDFDALDSGRFPGWKRTGWWFPVTYPFDHRLATPLIGPWYDVCRFYIPPPSDSHFFSASPEECNAVETAHPEYVFETGNAFQVSAFRDPATALCPTGFLRTPVYRLWNGRVDSNHRYVIDVGERDRMTAAGWTLEGIVFCVDDGGYSAPPL